MWFVEKLATILKKKFLHQTAFVSLGSVVNGVSLLVINIILARSLSQEVFGVFSLSILALSTMGELSDFGLNSGLLRFGSYYVATNQIDKFKQLLKTIWQWRLGLTVLLTVGGIVLSHPIAKYIFGQPSISAYIACAFLGTGGVILLGFLATFLQSKQMFFYQASVQSLKGILRLVIIVMLAVLGVKNLFIYLSAYIFVPWMLFLANYRVFPEGFTQVVVEEDVKKKLHSQLTKFSFWLTLSSLIAIASGKIDQLMVSHFLGLEKVAIFTVAWQFLQILPVIYGSISSVLIPKMSAVADKEGLVLFLRRTLKWILAGALGVGILVYPSQYLIALFFGANYISSMPVYLLLAYGHVLNIIIIPFSLVINIFNKTYLMVFSAIINLLINVLGSLTLIPLYGIMGVVYTFVFSMVFMLFWHIVVAVFLIKKVNLVVEK
jgi:O-antigen/teichoic acid export membrane protein